MKKKVTAYKSPTSNKVKNSKGKYGYIKAQSTLIETNSFPLKPR